MESCWSNELVLEFLSLYEKHPAIWDPININHKNRNYIADAWHSIKDELSVDVSVDFLKRKKESLMSTYRTLKRKVIASMKTGTAEEDIYKPSWFAFEKMHRFLRRTGVANETINTEVRVNLFPYSIIHMVCKNKCYFIKIETM